MPRDVEPSARDNPLFVQVLEKGIEVLRSFTAQRKMMTLGEIAEATSLSKSSVQRLVFSLEAMGYIAKHAKTRRFHLTPQVMAIGYNYLAADSVVDVANPFLAELTNTTGETVNLLEPSHHEMIYVARFASHRFIPMHMPIGCRIPMYCTASGRAYLSALPVDECRAMLEAMPLERHTPNTIVELDALMATLDETRELGYALNTEELFPGDMAVAMAVIGSQGQPIAAVNVVTPPSRWTVETVRKEIVSNLMECTRAITNGVRAFN
jgi:IclR family transcriptional regulator, pca regulon regulatory protein